MVVMNLFAFRHRIEKRSIFIQGSVELPIEIVVARGKRHIVGIGEVGDRSATVEKTLFFGTTAQQVEEVVKELLRKLGVPEDKWETIISTRREITY